MNNVFDKIIAENFSILRKRRLSGYRRLSEHQTGKIRKEIFQDVL
jgi:hypothetical protein